MARLHVRDFLSGFVQPLVAGGELHIGAPIPTGDAERWELELDHASVELTAVDEARTAVLSTLVCRPPAFVLEADDISLAVGLHNALFLVPPRAEEWSVSDRARRKIIDTALAQVSRPLTHDRRRVMARANSRFATLAHAMSSTITETPPSHVATFETLDGYGPRSRKSEPAMECGFVSSSDGTRGCSTRRASWLRRCAFVRSAFACSMLTPGFRVASIDIHPQL